MNVWKELVRIGASGVLVLALGLPPVAVAGREGWGNTHGRGGSELGGRLRRGSNLEGGTVNDLIPYQDAEKREVAVAARRPQAGSAPSS